MEGGKVWNAGKESFHPLKAWTSSSKINHENTQKLVNHFKKGFEGCHADVLLA